MPKPINIKGAIVGCGKIADNHAAVMTGIEGCEIVGVCDREPLMAQQLYDRFPVRKWYGGLEEMLCEARPDVVHITTPPESHFALAKICLEHGCNVYVEKPFTLFESDARQLIEIAEARGLKLTAGHDAQFGTAARRMRELVRSGYLGDGPVHMESYYGYEMGQAYAQALLGDTQHWVRRLPGKLLHNVISHGIARIAEFMPAESPIVIAHGFVSPFLRKLGEREVFDELRVILSADETVTGYFTFSSQMRPLLHEFRAYGTKNGLVLDPDQETLIKLRGTRYKSYAEKFIPPVAMARQYFGNLRTNLGYFMRREFHMKSGLNYLIEAFYRSIVENCAVPIPYREIVLTARIMDSIFAQLSAKRAGVSMPLEPALTTT